MSQLYSVAAPRWLQVPAAARSDQASLFLRRGADVHPFALRTVQAENLDGLILRGTEPRRKPVIEFGHFAGLHRDVVVREDQMHTPGQHVEPLMALMSTKHGFAALGRSDHFPATKLVDFGPAVHCGCHGVTQL